MSTLKKYYPLAVLVGSLCASATWAASFQYPHSVHRNGCPTAVENVGQNAQTLGQTNAMTEDGRKAGVGVDNNKGNAGANAKAQQGLLLPAVKQGKTPGQLTGDVGKADAGAAAK